MLPPRSNFLVDLFAVHIHSVMYTNDGECGSEKSSYSFPFSRFGNITA